MFRQTAPGSIDAITNQAGWTVTSPNSMYSYKSADCFIVGPQLAVQEQMQDQLLQQLRQHSLRDKLHTDASSSSAPPVSGRLCTDQYPLPAPVTVSKAASTANNSFSFQTGMPGQTQEALEALFEKAEAVVQDFIDSPQAAMLFGEDSTLESLTELCARLPSATRPPYLLSSPADTAGQIMNPPCTPQSCRKRPQPPAQHPTFPGTAHDYSMNTLEAPRSHAGGTTGNCRISIDAAGPTPRRRWGLDLSDEGSDYNPDWCRSSGITSGAPAAMFSPQLKQPRSSDCCISHSIRASDSPSLAGNLSLIQGSHAAAMQPAGTPKSSTGRKIKIKMKGAGSPMQGSGRSSCPGGYVSGGRSRMGRISSTAANMSFPVVLDLSTPPPNSPQTPADCANNSCAVAASPAGRSSPGAGALSRIAGGGGSSSMRLSGHKHSKDGRISDISQQSLRPVTAAVDRQSGPGALLSSPGALTGPEGVLHDAHEWPQAGSPAKRRSRLGASCETSSGGADLAFQSCFQAAAVPGGNADKVPAAADQHPSFTSWAIDSIATAAAAAVTMDAGEDGAVKYRSPFENAEAVKATLRAYEAAPVPHSALLPARVRGSRRSRQSTPGGKAAATAAVLLLGEPQQCGGSSNGSFGLDNGVTSDAKHQQQQPGQADLPPVAAAPPTAGEAGQAGCMFDSPMQMHEGGFGGGCAGLYCHNCGSGDSPQWRTGPEGPKTLCNRCGVRFKKSTPAYAAAANPAAVQAAAQAHALSLAASAHTAAVVTRPAQQSPFAATAVQNVSLSQQGQVMIPRCAADVGISITTQSGTGPSARRVSSQPLLLPCGPVDHASKGNTHVPPQPGRLNVPQQFHNVAGGSHPPLEQQQHRVLHLQLPRIRTKSQMLHGGAFPDAFGIAAGSSSSAGCSSLADPHSSSTATPSTGAGAAAAGCGDCTGLTQGSKPLSPGLLNHIAMMNLHGGNMQDSPASAMSSCSWAGTGIFGDTAAVAVAAGGTKRFCNVQHLENTGAHGVMMSSKQQRQQQVQQQCMLAADNPYSMYAPYCKGRPVTTSMPVVQPQATPAVPLAAAVAHTAAAGFAATAAPAGPQASSVQQQQAWPSYVELLQTGADCALPTECDRSDALAGCQSGDLDLEAMFTD